MSLYCMLLPPWVWLTRHREAAAHAEDLAGDEVRVRAREEEDGVGHLFRLRQAPERDGPDQRLAHLLRERCEERRVGGAGRDAVDLDSVARHLARQRLG